MAPEGAEVFVAPVHVHAYDRGSPFRIVADTTTFDIPGSVFGGMCRIGGVRDPVLLYHLSSKPPGIQSIQELRNHVPVRVAADLELMFWPEPLLVHLSVGRIILSQCDLFEQALKATAASRSLTDVAMHACMYLLYAHVLFVGFQAASTAGGGASFRHELLQMNVTALTPLAAAAFSGNPELFCTVSEACTELREPMWTQQEVTSRKNVL